MENPFFDRLNQIKEAAQRAAKQQKKSSEHRSQGASSAHLSRSKLEQRRKEVLKQRLVVLAICLAVLFAAYCFVAHSYRNRFLPRTSINDIKVGGLTAGETEDLLKKSVEQYRLRLHFQGKKEEVLKSSDLGYTYVSSGEAQKLLKVQPRMAWLVRLLGKKAKETVSTSYVYDQNALKTALLNLPEFARDEATPPANAHMSLTNDFVFEIVPEVKGNTLDPEVSLKAVDTAVKKGQTDLDLRKVKGAYLRPTVLKNDKNLKDTVKEINDLITTKVTLLCRDGTKRTVSRSSLIKWLDRDQEGNYSVDEKDIADHCWKIVEDLADQYDDVKDRMDFQTTKLGTKTLPCDAYGYRVDVDAVADELYQKILKHESGEVQVKSSLEEEPDATFGGTYIEVDVTNQHLWFYQNGSVFFETDCVTGLESDPERLTPSGIFAIYGKAEDKNLEGRITADGPVTYVSHVSYWMPFFESYGMHDAPWRDTFGGTIYKDQGSHGCVNLPVPAAKTIYEHAERGTPVIVVRESD